MLVNKLRWYMSNAGGPCYELLALTVLELAVVWL